MVLLTCKQERQQIFTPYMNYSNDFPLNMRFLGQNHNNNNNDDNYCTYS